MSLTDPNPGYWEEYGPFQKVKHDLIRSYLNGWFPKLASWAKKVVYLDTHAGRGRHVSGELGSPLVALTTLLEHSFRGELLRRCEFKFLFIERDPKNLLELDKELAALAPLPAGIQVDRISADAFEVLSKLVRRLKQDRTRIAPAFAFVDPYGFKVPGKLLSALMVAGRVELFINVIWRELDMAVRQNPAPDSALAKTLDSIFDGVEWRAEIIAEDVDTRIDQAVRLLGRKIGAKWWTHVRMVSGGKATRYLLLHLTNHDKGRELMKDCIWAVCPDGGFTVLKSDNPNQPMLIEPEPDLGPLTAWVKNKLRQRPHRWSELDDALRSELWRSPHLNKVIRDMHRASVVAAEQFSGRFSVKSDPVLRLR